MNQEELLRNYLEGKTGKIPDTDWGLYAKNLQGKEVSRGEILLSQGEVCNSLWHLTRGAVRKVELQNLSEKTTHFLIAPKVFTSFQSALNKTPSDLSIICQEDCQIMEIKFDDLQNLFDQSHAIERIGRRIVEDEYMEEFETRKMFLRLDALQRYEYIEKNQPEILSRFQLKDVASFLGVTPETLSRLRRSRFSS